MNNKALLWTAWLVISATAGGILWTTLTTTEADKTVFLPGATTHGHHQIEMACGACHTSSFADREAIQQSCETCHADALKEAKDDHPKSKFTDPRNADRLAVLDARYCVTCHVEHRAERTLAMGLTMPEDYCFLCHSEIGDERPSHEGMAFNTCASAGCHNYHDNRALYEDFLARHLDQPDTNHSGRVLTSNLRDVAGQLPHYPKDTFPVSPVAPDELQTDTMGADELAVIAEWSASSHARAGVTCAACHGANDAWIGKPGRDQCRGCHVDEADTFLAGKHGMRLNETVLGQKLTPMSPAMARLPMQPDAADETLDCNTCHGAHAFDAAAAAVDGCLTCHADEHSLAYRGSPHHSDISASDPGGRVTCATCHMPRVAKDYFWTFDHHLVQHNQSETLRPNEKMIRPICQNCHGLQFTLDALADESLIQSNFRGRPTVRVESMELARKRL